MITVIRAKIWKFSLSLLPYGFHVTHHSPPSAKGILGIRSGKNRNFSQRMFIKYPLILELDKILSITQNAKKPLACRLGLLTDQYFLITN